ncbi:MAG: glycosyltransferase family 4 protein [Actinomycetota bacterium]|nr:glycosyltransferase family 4 protein [Actinomycetota bacterium]
MKIALVHAHAWPEVRRGGERYLHDLAWYLGTAGHEVEVITGSSTASAQQLGPVLHRRVRNEPGALARRIGARPPETIGSRALRPLLRRFDVVHALTESATVASKLTGHRTVFTHLGYPDRVWLASQPRALRWFQLACRMADVTTAVSDAAAARVTECSGRPATGLFAGIRLDAFEPELAPREGPPTILFASAQNEGNKGLDVLLAAMDLLLDAHPDARLQVAGPGDGRWAFDALGERAERVRRAVDLVDPDTSMPDLYRSATVTALPSTGEALGLVLLESLACGTPVVAGADGGPTEVVTDDEIGRLVPVRDPAALATALGQAIGLARTPGTASRCHEHARRWDWATAIGPEHEALYRRVRG